MQASLPTGASRTADSLLPHSKPPVTSSAWLQARVDELLKEHKSQSISALLRLEAELGDARTALAQVSRSMLLRQSRVTACVPEALLGIVMAFCPT